MNKRFGIGQGEQASLDAYTTPNKVFAELPDAHLALIRRH